MEGRRDVRADPETASRPEGVFRSEGSVRPESDPRLNRLYERDPSSSAEPDRLTGARPISAQDARQASRNRPLLYALILGLVLAAIYIVATQVWTASEPKPANTATIASSPSDLPPAAPTVQPGDQRTTPVPQ